MGDKKTAPSVYAMKSAGARIACITAYDSTSGAIVDSVDPDVVLVGDSVANTMLGHSTTLFVDLDDMVRHTRAVASVVGNPLLIADLPFGSYQSSPSQAVDSAVRLMKAGAEGVKLEGPYIEAVEAIVKAGIPVMGHVGMTPQSFHGLGGFKVQGRSNADRVFDDASAIAAAGAFSIVLELVTSDVAKRITDTVPCPTIGIGAGSHCDGQIQVFHDVVGLTPFKLKHAKRYCNGLDELRSGVAQYVLEVRDGSFPSSEHSF